MSERLAGSVETFEQNSARFSSWRRQVGAMLITRSDDGYLAGLLTTAPQYILTFPQPGLHRIFRDVMLEPMELRLMPHEMIKRVLLPEAAFGPSPRLIAFAVKCFQESHCSSIAASSGNAASRVDMIRHDHKILHLVAVAIEVPQTCARSRKIPPVTRRRHRVRYPGPHASGS